MYMYRISSHNTHCQVKVKVRSSMPGIYGEYFVVYSEVWINIETIVQYNINNLYW